jgi:DNA polymerase (family 10)
MARRSPRSNSTPPTPTPTTPSAPPDSAPPPPTSTPPSTPPSTPTSTPTSNDAVAAALHELARLLELTGVDGFRVAAHSRAARAVEGLALPVASLARDQILAIDGIGPKLADKIAHLAASGTLDELAALRAQVPPGVLALMNIPGLGPKTARTLWIDGGITDTASLLRAIEDESILSLPRMGAKSVAKIKDSLAFATSANRRVWIAAADLLARRVTDLLIALPHVARVQAAGSLRRGKDTVGDIDLLVALAPDAPPSTPRDVLATFSAMHGVARVLASGDTKASVRVALPMELGRWASSITTDDPADDGTLQVDVRVVPLASWGAALCYFTGSKEHNVAMRARAQARGLTLNEWGLFRDDGLPGSPHERGIAPLAAREEADVHAALGLDFIPPELREDRGEFDAFTLAPSSAPQSAPSSARSSAPTAPRLVDLPDIKAELHAHTTASDGVLSIIQLASLARDRGFHTIAVTDHSRSSGVANGLSTERLLQHIDAIHAARALVPGIRILAGSEVDILVNGTLDYPDEILARLDVVVASPHVALTQDPDSATRRLLRALENPHVRVLGHPTGRLINRRAGLSPDMAQLYKAAAARRVALEINSHWMRLDLRDAHVRAAVDANCLIAINCDVHDAPDFDNLRFGVATARRGWCPAAQCVNTWPAPTLDAWLKR